MKTTADMTPLEVELHAPIEVMRHAVHTYDSMDRERFIDMLREDLEDEFDDSQPPLEEWSRQEVIEVLQSLVHDCKVEIDDDGSMVFYLYAIGRVVELWPTEKESA